MPGCYLIWEVTSQLISNIPRPRPSLRDSKADVDVAEVSNFRELDDAYIAIPRHGGTVLGVVPALLEN